MEKWIWKGRSAPPLFVSKRGGDQARSIDLVRLQSAKSVASVEIEGSKIPLLPSTSLDQVSL